jgi:hypothetical protein
MVDTTAPTGSADRAWIGTRRPPREPPRRPSAASGKRPDHPRIATLLLGPRSRARPPRNRVPPVFQGEQLQPADKVIAARRWASSCSSRRRALFLVEPGPTVATAIALAALDHTQTIGDSAPRSSTPTDSAIDPERLPATAFVSHSRVGRAHARASGGSGTAGNRRAGTTRLSRSARRRRQRSATQAMSGCRGVARRNRFSTGASSLGAGSSGGSSTSRGSSGGSDGCRSGGFVWPRDG